MFVVLPYRARISFFRVPFMTLAVIAVCLLIHAYERFVTGPLVHVPAEFNPLRMIIHSVTHADWPHVIFNCLFFFLFAAPVELMLGTGVFTFYFFVFCIGVETLSGLVYLISERWMYISVGLSGVVMAYMALFSYLLPHAQIRFAYWIAWAVGVFTVPAWAVALWYVGWNIYDQFTVTGSRINFVAHIAGAFLGLLVGLRYFRKRRHWSTEQVGEDEAFELERHSFVKDEGLLIKTESMLSLPLILAIAYFGIIIIVSYLVMALTSHTAASLMVGMGIFMGWYFFLQFRNPVPMHVRYQQALKALAEDNVRTAAATLEVLAKQGYTKARLTLGQMHMKGRGVLLSKRLATEYFHQAAEAGNADAQFLLGRAYLYSDGVPGNNDTAQQWFERAARKGRPEAARAIGHMYETGRTGDREHDYEQCLYWYRRAAELFRARGEQEEAELVETHIKGLMGET